jgi:hypothetical protein
VQRLPADAGLLQLRLARKAICNDVGFGIGLANRRQESDLAAAEGLDYSIP